MEHVIYSDGNSKGIAWVIKTNDRVRRQFRDHADMYLDKVDNLQSKYIALHVGIFWSIGVFVIKHNDVVRIKLDSENMLAHLRTDAKASDAFVEQRKRFINQLAAQRNLKIIYEETAVEENLATRLLVPEAH